jgi:hypothetical protein
MRAVPRVNWTGVIIVLAAAAMFGMLVLSPLPDRSLKVTVTCDREDVGAVWQVTATSQLQESAETGLSVDGNLAMGRVVAGGGKLTFDPVVIPLGQQRQVQVYLRSALSSRPVAGYVLPDDCKKAPKALK